MTTLPATVGRLKRLRALRVEGNALVTLPEEIGRLNGLQALTLDDNQFFRVPTVILQLGSLQHLSLKSNQLTELPEEIGLLSNLRSLNLDANQLDELPKEIGLLTRLQLLSVDDNLLTDLTPEVGKLVELRDLTISANRLTQLPTEIGQLTRLLRLDLFGNRLTNLPQNIGKLRQLESFGLSANNLTVLPDAIGQVTQLQALWLSGNSLTALPDVVGRLTHLTKLYVAGNQLTALPATIWQLVQLEDLFLGGNPIIALPEAVGRLTRLRRLYLAMAQLSRLPSSLCKLGALEELYLHENPALGLPTELLGPTHSDVEHHGETPANPKGILDFYLRARGESRPLNEAKLVLIGFGEVGKTSLVRRLVHDTFIPGEAKTEGIAITDWPIRLNGTEDISLHIWDFGGQEIMHATHRFFLSQRSVYLLVLNGRGGRQQADAAYWLNLIATYAPDSPVIIVRNKIREDPCALDRTTLRRDFPTIRAFIDTDCADRTGIDDLAAAIRRETDPGAQEALGFVLHCLGIVLNYRDDPRLRDTNVLNPHWVTEGIYDILNHPALTEEPAELRVADLRGMLDPARFPPERHDFLLQLMRRFELAVPFPEQDDLYLVPERLSPEQPADLGAFDAAHCLNFAYDYPTLLPEGLLPRFIVRTHILSTGCPRWRSGVVLRLEGNRALVIGDAINRRVSITIDGPVAGRRRLLAVIRYDLEYIHRSYKFQPQAIVPVPGHPDVVVPYDNLVTFERDGLPKFPVVIEGRTTMLDVRQLLDGVDLAPPKPADPAARREAQPTTAFISYAHKDEPLRAELDTHLKLLQVTGELDAWHDRSITPGEKWEGQINDNLQRTDIVLLLLSPAFIASDYCRKEMEIALQREAAGQTRVVLNIARPCGWRHLPVHANQALPKDGKPVADAGHEQGHRDAAWVQVEDGIRRVLKALARRSG